METNRCGQQRATCRHGGNTGRDPSVPRDPGSCRADKTRKGSGKELNQDGEDEAMTTESGEVNRHNGEFDDMTITTEDLGAVVTRGQRRNERRSRRSLKVSVAGTGPLKNRKVMEEYRVSCVAIRMGKVKVS
ncbi:hypothetical protein Pcinc_023361 [Petrolisthes cinctipes]|uniref:Uncharacterized protein n=1 Tax=Petrolisthes cinctipes TaxID=88211 RepID=A0AAE1FDC6_PETCI|nr:hypothetical protein Pcinc_023361 [Petrolisthes cinctipes]